MSVTAIIDNGASRIKYGLETYEKPKSMSNNTAHMKKQMLSYVGDQLDAPINGSLLHYNRCNNITNFNSLKLFELYFFNVLDHLSVDI